MFNKILTTISLSLIRLYQITLSPDKWIPSLWLKGRVCRHQPHCSQYALEYLQTYWFMRSIIPIVDRVSNCVPGSGIIHDPVPTQKKNNTKKGVKPYKVVFFSSAPIGVPFLEELSKHEWFEIVWVVTQPDQPSGRWMNLQANIIKQWSNEHITNCPIITPQTLRTSHKRYGWEAKESIQALKQLKPDFFVVIAYGKIIPQKILDIPAIAPINIHGSLLPKYRWASPIQTTLLHGDQTSGITLMHMSAWLDEGDIIDQLTLPLHYTTTSKDLIDCFSSQWPKFTLETLINLAQGKISAKPQWDGATVTSKIHKDDGLVDIATLPLKELLKRYNAYYLRPKIYFVYHDKRVIIEEIDINDQLWEQKKNESLIDSKFTLNSCIQTIIVKPEWKKRMDWLSWRLWYGWRSWWK